MTLFARTIPAAALLGAVTALAACDDTATAVPAAGNDAEVAARGACVRDVRSTTGNPEVSVLSSSFSEAGTEVILRVGETGTWRCIAYQDGTTADITSMTDEGTL